jgi:dolichol-phosphate mannosyltransferase
MELSIVLPAYKEAENLKKILPEIHAQVSKLNIEYEILIVDTIEKMDDTFDVCKSNNAVYIMREDGNYYGDAIRTGIKRASGKYILIMDADGSHEPKSILEIYNKITSENLDVVVGSRYCKGGKTDNNFILKMMSWSLNLTYKIIFALKVNDCSNSFRMYDSAKLKSLSLECINFDIVEEILIKLQLMYSDLAIGEVPVHFKKRDKGVSKRDLVKFILTYFVTIKRLLELKKKVQVSKVE